MRNLKFKVITRHLEETGDKKAVRLTLLSGEWEGRFQNQSYGYVELNVVLPAEEYDNYPIGSTFELRSL